jgi:chorismate-pyruvate lyase
MPELDVLIQTFSDDTARLGRFDQVTASDMPTSYRTLLAHNEHMTVTVEAFYGCSVNVEVLASKRESNLYCREILLRKTTDNTVVQFGIVRLDLNALDSSVATEILAEKTPLGRVLIKHNVLRQVELVDLWRIWCGESLAKFFSVPVDSETFGRTALIHFDGNPALELLEIIAPVPD